MKEGTFGEWMAAGGRLAALMDVGFEAPARAEGRIHRVSVM